MVKREIEFGACAVMTPGFAAKLAQAASEVASEMYLERGRARLSMDSLISILSMDLRRGARVVVCADGADEGPAAERICAMLRGE